MSTAFKLLDNFAAITTLVTATHPSIARSTDLAACRALPRGHLAAYVKNYDAVVRFVRRTRPRVAHAIALQTCKFE